MEPSSLTQDPVQPNGELDAISVYLCWKDSTRHLRSWSIQHLHVRNAVQSLFELFIGPSRRRSKDAFSVTNNSQTCGGQGSEHNFKTCPSQIRSQLLLLLWTCLPGLLLPLCRLKHPHRQTNPSTTPQTTRMQMRLFVEEEAEEEVVAEEEEEVEEAEVVGEEVEVVEVMMTMHPITLTGTASNCPTFCNENIYFQDKLD